jgi:hypothetical protein
MVFSLCGLILILVSQADKVLASAIPLTVSRHQRVTPPSREEIPSYLIPGQPSPNKSIFFTGQSPIDRPAVKEWAAKAGLTSIGAVWQSGDNFLEISNYNATYEELVQFQLDFSTVFAEYSSGIAYLLIAKGFDPNPDSIFYTIELEALIKSNKVNKIIRLDMKSDLTGPEDWSSVDTVYWKKGDPKPGV